MFQLLGCLAITAVGLLGFVVAFVQPAMQIRRAQHWPAIPCRLLEGAVVMDVSSNRGERDLESHQRTVTWYRRVVRYTYTHTGQTHTGDRYAFGFFSVPTASHAAEIRDALAGSARLTCSVDPADPKPAVLPRGMTATIWAGLLGLALVALGALGWPR